MKLQNKMLHIEFFLLYHRQVLYGWKIEGVFQVQYGMVNKKGNFLEYAIEGLLLFLLPFSIVENYSHYSVIKSN